MKKYMGNNTLKSLMDNILSVVPSKEITEDEVQEMYNASTNEEGNEDDPVDETPENPETSGVKIVLAENGSLGSNCIFEADTNSGEKISVNVSENGSATLELTEDQYNDIQCVFARNTDTTETWYAEIEFTADKVVDGVVTVTTDDLGIF